MNENNTPRNETTKADRMAEKVAKLLRQAEDVAGTPEELVFQERAFALLAKYGLDEAKVRQLNEDQGVAQPGTVKVDLVVAKGKYVPMQVTLLGQLAFALHCRVVQYGSKGAIRCELWGFPEHVTRVQLAFELLRPQMLRQVEKAKPAYYVDSGKLRIYRRSWMVGFVSEVSSRVAGQEKAAAGAAGALVLFQSAGDAAQKALDEAHPNARAAKSRSKFDAQGYTRGRLEGERAELNRSVS